MAAPPINSPGSDPPETGDLFSETPESSELEAKLRRTLPERIGRYRIKRKIAEGGMGAVYEAVQESPRRVVALKVMKPGLASRSALRRFEYEAQILARLRHPGIAQIFEAGSDATAGGDSIPYFVMEYIPNARPINEYAAVHDLPLKDRLGMFIRVCEAVHHGHVKGIIHRDLKPTNILVDSNGQPKVIDFGVARATDSDMAVTTLQTDVGQLIGTLQWMSPEQVEADPHDLDTRSDVYSLGVVLFELVTGQLPYDILKSPVYEAARIIREQAPARPSSISYVARGDLEHIVLKALEKDRNRRYSSASDLAEDVKRFLASEPITARGATLAYELRKFAVRNRALCVFLAVIASSLIAMSGVVGAAAWRSSAAAREARERADVALQLQDLMRKVVRLDDTRIAWNPQAALADLDQIGEQLSGPVPMSSEIAADVHARTARGYFQIGNLPKAAAHAERALKIYQAQPADPTSPEMIAMRTIAGLAARAGGSLAQAEGELRMAAAGANPPDHAANNLAVVMIESENPERCREAWRKLRSLYAAEPPGPVREVISRNRMLAALAAGDVYDAVFISLEHGQTPSCSAASPWLEAAPLHNFAVIHGDSPRLKVIDLRQLPGAERMPSLAESRALVTEAQAAALRDRLDKLFGTESRATSLRAALTGAVFDYHQKRSQFELDAFRRSIDAASMAELTLVSEALDELERLPIERSLRGRAMQDLCREIWPPDSGQPPSMLAALVRPSNPESMAGYGHWRAMMDGTDPAAARAALKWAEAHQGMTAEGLRQSVRALALARLNRFFDAERAARSAFELNRTHFYGGARHDLCILAWSQRELGRRNERDETLAKVREMTPPRLRPALELPVASAHAGPDDLDVAVLYSAAMR